MNMTLDKVHMLELSKCQQSQSVKWKESRVGRVTASCFGDVLLRKSPPTESFVNTFFDTSHNSTIPAVINPGLQNEARACNAYCSKSVYTLGLVVNPSLP